MDTKICTSCGEEKEVDKFDLSFSGSHRKNRCKTCSEKRERVLVRMRFFDALGRACACCGEDDPRFLTLDHVDNTGSDHRKKFNGHQIYRQAYIEGFPRDKYQVLCYNCNSGRDKNGGVCPHKDSHTKEQAWKEMEDWIARIGQAYVDKEGSSKTYFQEGFDPRRMQLNRRVLKPCQYCGEMFGSNEMVRHKREKHRNDFLAMRQKCLSLGRNK